MYVIIYIYVKVCIAAAAAALFAGRPGSVQVSLVASFWWRRGVDVTSDSLCRNYGEDRGKVWDLMI